MKAGKGQGHTDTKTVTVAQLLVMRAAMAVCCCYRRGPACQYDCYAMFSSYVSVLNQEIGWEERLRNDLFCVGWNVKPQLNQSTFCLFVVVL